MGIEKKIFNFYQKIYILNINKIEKSLVIFFIIFPTTMYGIFDMYPVFHDEIINTYKADIGLVFDYALRPFFYWINYISYNLFGHNTTSLIYASSLASILTYILIFIILRKEAPFIISVLITLLLASSPLIVKLSTRAMPHMYGSLFCLITLYFIQKSITQKNYKIYLYLGGLSANLMLATHPTNMGYFIAFISWGLGGIILPLSIRNLFYGNRHNKPECFHFLFSILFFFFILNILYLLYFGKIYLDQFWRITIKIDLEQYSGYFKPWHWYLEYLWIENSLLFTSAGISVFLLASSRFIKNPNYNDNQQNKNLNLFFLVSLCITIELISLSYSSWKFERVIVTAYPLLFLWIGLLFSYCFFRISYKYYFLMLLATVSMIIIADNFIFKKNYLNSIRSNIQLSKARYISLAEILINLQSKVIGFIGEDSFRGSINRYLIISQKEIFAYNSVNQILEKTEGIELLKKSMIEKNIKFLITQSFRKKSRRIETESEEYKILSKKLKSIGGQKIYIDHYVDLWSFDLEN